MPFSLRRRKTVSDEKEVVPHINDKEVVPHSGKEVIEPYTHKEVATSDEKQVIDTAQKEAIEQPEKEVVESADKEVINAAEKEVLHPDPPVLKTYEIAIRSRQHQSLEIRHGREVLYSIRRKEKKKSLFSSPSIWIKIYDNNHIPQSHLSFPVVAAARILTGPDFHVCLGDPDSGLGNWAGIDSTGSGYKFTVNRRRFVLEPEFGFTLGTYKLKEGDSGEMLAKLRTSAGSAEDANVLAMVDYFAELHRAPELLSMAAMLGIDEVMKVAARGEKEGKHGI